MKRLLLVLTALCCTAIVAPCTNHTLSGMVSAAVDGEAIAFATVTLQPGNHAVQTDHSGRYHIVVPAGNYTATATFVGYSAASAHVSLNSDRTLNFALKENAQLLQEVVVTAKEGTGLSSSSRIDRDAMAHLQPTSFADLLELLPGNISHDPDMGSVSSIKLRETGTMGAGGSATDNPDYAITSLGTLFMVDGAPINGDANLQNVPEANSDPTSPEYKRDATNRGVDMRTLSTDNIESVEVVRGIPSAEYGNLTSGLVNIKRIRRATPLTARFKADQYSKLVSLGKGFVLGGYGHIANIDGGWLSSKVDPRNNLENYKRLNLSARLNMRWEATSLSVGWITGVDYTGSFDNAKTDPDLSYMKVNEYKSSYNRINYTSDLTLSFKKPRWLSTVNANISASYQRDRLERHKQVAPQRASVAPTTMTEGVNDGQYLLSEYVADYLSDGRPLNLFVKLKAEGSVKWRRTTHNYKAGTEWTLSKNYGNGQVYDLTRPLSASWTTRPRAYKDIPALQVLSFFAEENADVTLGNTSLEIQAGLRTQQMPSLAARYRLSGHICIDPRLNVKFSFPTTTVSGRPLKLFLAGGYGMTTKMPTIDYLYPQVHYSDFIQLNYYDVNAPLERSRISLRTYIDDAVNYELKAARNHKWEIRLGASLGSNRLQLTYFDERMSGGYRYSSIYRPYTYTRYATSDIDPTTLTTAPSLDDLAHSEVAELSGYRIVTNGSRLVKRGVELTLNTARWNALRTALTLTGAWFRSTYTNSQMLYDPASVVVDNRAVSDSYVGYYRADDGRVNEQLNTNFMFDTQITRWGLVFTTSVQCMWYVSTRKLWQNGVPEQYLDVADGLLHPYTEAMRSDALLQHLVKTYNDDVFRRQTTPIALYINLKATKTIGKHLKVAVFANRILDYLPDYRSNGLMVRRSASPYFGMELNFSL